MKVSTLSVLRFANVVFTHNRSLDGIKNTHFVILGNKVSNKVVTVVCRRFKTNDDVALLKGTEFGKQQMEAIIVICKFERLDEYFTVRR